MVDSMESVPLAQAESLDLETVYRFHASFVASVGARILGPSGDVDDLVHDVFVEVHRSLGALRDPGAVRPWLARIAVRMARRRLQRRRVRRFLRLEDAAPELAGAGAGAEEHMALQEVYACLDRLKPNERVAWVCKFVIGMTLEEIVKSTGASQSTVQRRIRKAETLLEKMLGEGK